jgi:hypothetical protein
MIVSHYLYSVSKRGQRMHQPPDKPKDSYRILVHSIGTAKPAACAAIAKGLGLSVAAVVARLYRAPAVLVDGIEQSVAQQMTGLLQEIGYQAEVQSMQQAAPPPSRLHDVAVYPKDPDYLISTAKSIAEFIGVPEAETLQMLLTPPGIVLGSVSEATVQAFTAQLGEGASIVSSVTETATYELFLGDAPGLVRARLLADLRDNNIQLLGETGLVATGVEHATARALWRRHQASGALRVVNRDFLRFDLVCEQVANGFDLATPQQIDCLQSIAGIPAEMVDQVLHALPLTLLEAVPNGELETAMRALTEVGLVMRADLVTFQMLGLEIVAISDATATLNTLLSHGLLEPGDALPRTPFQLPAKLPELYAKMIKSSLQNSGADVDFVEMVT